MVNFTAEHVGTLVEVVEPNGDSIVKHLRSSIKYMEILTKRAKLVMCFIFYRGPSV